MSDGFPLPPEDMSDPQKAYEGYLRYLERTGLSPSTKRTYGGEVKQYVLWLQQQLEFPLDEVLTSDIVRDQVVRTYRRALLGRRKASGVDTAMAAVGNFYIWTGLGAAKIKASPKPEYAPKSLPLRQAVQVLRQAEKTSVRELAIMLLGMHCGLRVSEIADLDVDDVWTSSQRGRVVVRRGKGKDGGKQREVPLSSKTREVIEHWKAERGKYPGADRLHQGRRPLFLSREGNRMAIRSVRYAINQAGARAGVPVGPHILRHTMATQMVENGRPLTEVKEVLGHDSITTTSRYTRPSKESMAAGVESSAIEF